MAGISRDDVANLARLARIDMAPAELDHLASELGVILNAVARVQDVPPTSHPLPLQNVYRKDEVIQSLTPEAALSAAPASEGQRFKVPKILGEEA
jgi:aspartyl-tRNA(Asn)/glutamyl-tRNA(Gln) amidotransferase subunit C